MSKPVIGKGKTNSKIIYIYVRICRAFMLKYLPIIAITSKKITYDVLKCIVSTQHLKQITKNYVSLWKASKISRDNFNKYLYESSETLDLNPIRIVNDNR